MILAGAHIDTVSATVGGDRGGEAIGLCCLFSEVQADPSPDLSLKGGISNAWGGTILPIILYLRSTDAR